MLDVEAALARACARADLVPQAAAEEITAAAQAERFDVAALARAAGDHVSPVVPLVHALRAQVSDAAGEHVHLGATSQDVVDTAAMLVARRALVPILEDALAAADAASELARAHRDTPIIGRTLLQQALPTTFGAKAASWLAAIDAARADLAAVPLLVQLGGPVGTLVAYGDRGPAVMVALAVELGLSLTPLAWHTDRGRPARLASALGTLAGVVAKPARDVTLLAQGEVGEVREGGEGRGGSSAMAHKRNPVASISTLACAARTPGLVATILAAMPQEHERAAGGWQAESETLSDLLRLTGAAVAWARDLLEHLEVDERRMRANLNAFLEDPDAHAIAVEQHVAAAAALVDRALAAHRALEAA